ISNTDRYFASFVILNWEQELWIFDKKRKSNNGVLKKIKLYNANMNKTEPLSNCPEGGLVQFCKNEHIVWCMDKEVYKSHEVPLNQGNTTAPSEATWTIKKLDLNDTTAQIIDVGSSITANESFFGFSADGNNFLTWDSQNAALRLHKSTPNEKKAAIITV